MMLMKKVVAAAALSVFSLSAYAVDIEISPTEAYEKTQAADQTVLLVDVRDPVEIMFVGFSDAVDVNIPFLLVDRNEWDEERGIFKLNRNPDFIEQLNAELEKRGLDKNTEIITMCRSGSERGKPSADFLRENGFPNARYVVNGFQGSALKEGEHAGKRLQNGWQNSDLPWGSQLDADKIYQPGK